MQAIYNRLTTVQRKLDAPFFLLAWLIVGIEKDEGFLLFSPAKDKRCEKKWNKE